MSAPDRVDLDVLRGLLDALPYGLPWRHQAGDPHVWTAADTDEDEGPSVYVNGGLYANQSRTAALIAAAVNALPGLIERVEAAEAERDEFRRGMAVAVHRGQRQAKVEALAEAARYLRRQGAARFEAHGPNDPRGAALWDAGCAINPHDGDALAVDREAQR